MARLSRSSRAGATRPTRSYSATPLAATEYKDFSGGVNLGQPLELATNELIDIKNMEILAGDHWLQGRRGQTNFLASSINSSPIRTLYRFYKQTGTGITVATSGTEIYKVSDAGVQTSIRDATMTNDKKFSVVTWSAKDKVYLTNGVEAIRVWDGITATTAVLGGSPPITPWIELHQDRLWAISGNLAQFSDLLADNVWPGANALNVSDEFGGTLKAIVSLGQVLLLMKDSGLYRFQGSPLLGGELTRFSKFGCIAPYTARKVNIGGAIGCLYVSNDGVYFTDGFSAYKVSPKIDPVFTGFFRNAVAHFHGRKRQYWLSFNTAGGANDQLWVLSNVGNDITPKLAWVQHTGFKAESFMEWDGGSDTGQFFYGRSDTGMIRQADIGSQDVGSNYECSFQTRWDDYGDPRVNKQVRWLEPVYDAAMAVSYQVLYSFGKRLASGQLEFELSPAITWTNNNDIVANWGVPWAGAIASANKRTSALNFQFGRYISHKFFNTGDGAAFKFYALTSEAKTRDRKHYEPYSLSQQQ